MEKKAFIFICVILTLSCCSAPEEPTSNYNQQPNPNYSVMVNCNHKTMIEAGKYDWVSFAYSGILSDDNAYEVRGVRENDCKAEQVEVEMVRLRMTPFSKPPKAQLEDQGFRPATLEELLALSVMHPNLQESYVIALGSEWKAHCGHTNVPILQKSEGKQVLSLSETWESDAFDRKDIHYLAVKMSI